MSNTKQPTGQQFTSKDEVYAAHQAIVDALGGHRGKELDLLVKLAHTVIAGIRETQPHPTGQMTAEELWDQHSRLIPSTESECAPHADIVVMDKENYLRCMEQNAAQQTAALREELIQKKIQHDAAQAYDNRCIDERDARIKELEDENRMWRKRFLEQKKLVTEKDARIAELEKECARWKYAHEDMTRNMEATHIASCEKEKELVAVTKERDGLRIDIKVTDEALSKAIAQRDEAVNIAEELITQLEYIEEKHVKTGTTPAVLTQCKTRLSRLSCGEPKHPETCPVCNSEGWVTFASKCGGGQCMDCGAEEKTTP